MFLQTLQVFLCIALLLCNIQFYQTMVFLELPARDKIWRYAFQWFYLHLQGIECFEPLFAAMWGVYYSVIFPTLYNICNLFT